MKTLFSLLLFCSFVALSAQSQMVITRNDGTKLSIRIADIQDVTFPDDNNLVAEVCYNGYWLHPDQWVQLSATCYTQMGVETPAQISWSSSDTSVATVDAKGVVTAVADGECNIFASTDGGYGFMPLHVVTQPMLDIQLENVSNSFCSYKIYPSDPSLRYYYDVRVQSGDYSVDGMDQHGSEEQNMYHFALDWWDFCGSLYGQTALDFMNEYGLVSGPAADAEEGLIPGQQYCIFAFAVHEDGSLASPVEVTKFITPQPEASDITFEVSMGTITATEATFSVTPSNNDPYFVCVQKASFVDWYVEHDCVDDSMVPKLVDAFNPAVYPEVYCQGPVTRSTSDFLKSVSKDTDYYVILFGYNDGQTSPVTLVKFHSGK